MKKIDWMIHYVVDEAECPYLVNAHTHGMEKYNHQDFQFVLNEGMENVGWILNTLGLRVQNGERFNNGQTIKNFSNGYDGRFQEFYETGRKVLRFIIPDKYGRFPEDDECSFVLSLQIRELSSVNYLTCRRFR